MLPVVCLGAPEALQGVPWRKNEEANDSTTTAPNFGGVLQTASGEYDVAT